VKYTPAGGTVDVKLERTDREYFIAVADTGIGIPPEAQSLVFRRFYRIDRARSRASAAEGGSGAGLGLAIGKWIAEVHQGSLELTRSGPKGSIFTARIPQ
jgi:signal transduction histidine kinase